MQVSVADIAGQLGGEVVGDLTLLVSRIAPLDQAGPGDISFVAHGRYRAQLATTRAGCLIVGPALAEEALRRGTAIVTPDPYLYYAKLSQWWARRVRGGGAIGVHPSAVVEPDATLGEGVTIGPLSYVGSGAVIGTGTHIGARVVIAERCVVGERCLLHPGVVVGADGFGFAPAVVDGERRWEKIEQLGAVRIGNDVEIGANTCIDRGALGDTVIEDGVKLDNLIQVGHNVHIGAHSAMAGCVGIAGSARIGRRCTVGGGAIVLGHLELADDVHITAASVVSRSIREPGQYSGMFPIDDNASWEKNAATLRHLHALRERLRALEKKLS